MTFWIFFLLVLLGGLSLLYFGFRAVYLSSTYRQNYWRARGEEAQRNYYKYVHYKMLQPLFFVPGFLLLFASFLVFAFHMKDLDEAEKQQKAYFQRYEKLVFEEEKSEWLSTDVGIAATNKTQELALMLPKLNGDAKMKLVDNIINAKFAGTNKTSSLSFAFSDADYRDFLAKATSYELKGNAITFIYEDEVVKEDVKEVDVPGELVHGGIRYAQVNGKHVLFHKEKKVTKTATKVKKRMKCTMN